MNIAHRISAISKIYPDKKSVVFSERQSDGSYRYPSYTFKEFEERSNQFAHRFGRQGIREGMRVLLFITPRLDFSVIVFSLFKIGAVPVLIDPGMGIKNLLNSIQQVRPEAMVSIGKVHWIRRVLRSKFKSVRIKISLDRVGGATHYLYENLNLESHEFSPVNVKASDLSAILFTSGGTGVPKGVLYTHGILNTQTDALKEMFHLTPDNSDLPGFPLFALFTLAMGMTSTIPDMDPTKPASCDPKKIVQNIIDSRSTFVAGSPAIWEKVGNYCVEHSIKLPSVKQVVMFGAPVRAEIHELFKKVLVGGDTYTPYGATECLPVSLISGSEVLNGKSQKSLKGFGTCIGRAVPRTSIKIIPTSDIPESQIHELPRGSIGEILVSGDQVTPAYFEMPEETRKAKIQIGETIWHRMGDMGHLDEENNLWFLGRKSHRVEISPELTLYPLEVEAIFNQHPEVKRTALVKVMDQGTATPVIVIERKDACTKMADTFLSDLQKLRLKTSSSELIHQFYLHPGFPVDVRHNIKIDRLKLTAWAQEKGIHV
jgi:acyl-CoA synthetase (AMP-forming)/AMP-acid ligase II